MPVLDEPQSGEVPKMTFGRTPKRRPEVEMQAISRTAHEDFSEAMARQTTFRITDGSVVGKIRTKKRAFDTKETLEQFFSGSAGFPGSSAYNYVDQHVQASVVSLSTDQRPLQSPSDLPSESSESFVNAINSLTSLQRTEVIDLRSTNSNCNEPARTYEVSYEMPSINIPVSSTLPPGADASYLLNYSFGSSGDARIPSQMNNYPTCSVAVSVDASPAQTRLPESVPSCSNYADYSFQGNSASHKDRSSPPMPHPTQASAPILPFSNSHELNAGNIVRSHDLGTSVLQTHQYADQVDRPEPHGMSDGPSNNSDLNSATTLPFKIVRVEGNGAVQYVCTDQSTGEERGPVDVTDVLNHFLDQFTEFLAPANVNPSVDYRTSADSTYFGTDDEGSIATSPATSLWSPLSAIPNDSSELQSTNHYPFFT